MATDIGEYIVGAYLKTIMDCDYVDYNVRIPGGGYRGLSELDVIGLDLKTKTAYVCEVTTHLRGTLYKDNPTTVQKITKKHAVQKEYAKIKLNDFETVRYMFWSPVVPVGYITENLANLSSLELVINKEYTRCIDQLKEVANNTTNDLGNPFLRMLQIIGHLR
ncbi:hypothetical protein QTG56_25970 (plasmid) [Rossellomorea sp. AcN35-11]|nr:hypothetical protein [Rossellomorea aquimaris]WJV32065.1 hypothetical protein QTG56_25970 [Rossellomorea sp. AcN35-11]